MERVLEAMVMHIRGPLPATHTGRITTQIWQCRYIGRVKVRDAIKTDDGPAADQPNKRKVHAERPDMLIMLFELNQWDLSWYTDVLTY